MQSEQANAGSRAWLREEQRAGGGASRPVVLLGLLATAMAIGQCWCAATLLTDALLERRDGVVGLLVGFAVLALLRTAVSVAGDRVAFNAGASARRRLRSDALSRLLSAGPAQLRAQHTGELTTTVVD